LCLLLSTTGSNSDRFACCEEERPLPRDCGSFHAPGDLARQRQRRRSTESAFRNASRAQLWKSVAVAARHHAIYARQVEEAGWPGLAGLRPTERAWELRARRETIRSWGADSAARQPTAR